MREPPGFSLFYQCSVFLHICFQIFRKSLKIERLGQPKPSKNPNLLSKHYIVNDTYLKFPFRPISCLNINKVICLPGTVMRYGMGSEHK